MTVDADGLAKLLERFGLPTIYLAVMAWLAFQFIKGPAMVLASKMGDGAGILAKSGSLFLARLTTSLEATHLEHVEIRSGASAGVAEIKATITAESTATREHVTEEVGKIRDRVSSAQTTIETTVRQATGDHAACHEALAPSARGTLPTFPERGYATCGS
jgi:hypothetical protein